jgi:hypothetical protein
MVAAGPFVWQARPDFDPEAEAPTGGLGFFRFLPRSAGRGRRPVAPAAASSMEISEGGDDYD